MYIASRVATPLIAALEALANEYKNSTYKVEVKTDIKK